MQAGRMNRLITFWVEALASQNQFGEKVLSFVQYNEGTNYWAEIRPISGKESEYAKSFSATVSHRISTRYIPAEDPTFNTVLPDWQVRYGNRKFEINGVANRFEANKEYWLFCTELVQ